MTKCICIFFFLVDEEPPAEAEPKFNPFTGAGRRLDGKPSMQQAPLSWTSISKDKQVDTRTVTGQPSSGSTSRNASRQSEGKLVFGGNASRTPKETKKVWLLALCHFKMSGSALNSFINQDYLRYMHISYLEIDTISL